MKPFRAPGTLVRKHLLLGALAAFVLAAAAACPTRPVLEPVPAEVREVAGYASLRYERGGSSTRVRIAFLIRLPGLGRIEALGALNTSLFEVRVREPEAVLIVPSKKAAWRDRRETVLEAGLGFPLGLDEIAALLCGRWGGAADGPFAAWSFERDASGRVVSGGREGFSFRIEETFAGSGVPRRIKFEADDSAGTISLLRLEFNRDKPESLYDLDAFPAFARVTREEMERLLRDED